MTVALYELADRYVQLVALCDEDPEADLELLLDQVHGQIEQKAEAIISIAQGLQKLSDARAEEAQRLRQRASVVERAADRLKAYVLAQMNAAGIKALDTTRFTLDVRTNPPAVNVLDASKVPSEFQRTKIEIAVDKRAILAHYQATGEITAGTEITRGERLGIR